MKKFLLSFFRDFQTLQGNAVEIEPEKLDEHVQNMLLPNEEIRSVTQVIRDVFVFTDYRLICIDYQGVTGIQTEYRSIPYRSISSWSLETAGPVGISKVLKIWIFGNVKPFKVRISREYETLSIEMAFAEIVLTRDFT